MLPTVFKAVISFIIVLLLALLLSIVDFTLPEERDYTGLTDHCIPDIAYDATFNQVIVEVGNIHNKFPRFGLKKK